MDLITLALAMQNSGGGGGGGGDAGAPLIVPGELTDDPGELSVQIETELADIYTAAEAGKTVYLEWKDGGDATTLQLVAREYDDEEETYSLTFGAAIFAEDTPVIVSVRFDDDLTGPLKLKKGVKYDIEVRHDLDSDTWEANEYDLEAFQVNPKSVSVRVIDDYGSSSMFDCYFVLSVQINTNNVMLELVDMRQNVSAGDKYISMLVFPDGRVARRI